MTIIVLLFYSDKLIFVVTSLLHISGIAIGLLGYHQRKPAGEKMKKLNKH